MVWSKINPKDGKPRYVKKIGNAVVPTTSSQGALDDMPEGWEARIIDGNLRIKKK